MEQFTEYAIRVTLPGMSPRVTPYATFPRDAIRAYDHAVSLHGEEAVEFMSRQVQRTDWVPGKLPPPPDPDGRVQAIPAPAGPVCGETLYERPIRDAGSIDTWQERA